MHASRASELREEAHVVVEERLDLVDRRSGSSRSGRGRSRTRTRCTPRGRCPRRESTFGSTMPQPPSSIHPVREHTRQPSPPQKMQLTASSADGSVKGKKSGRKRVRIVSSPNSARTNVSMVPNRSPSVMPRSTASASIWWNTGELRGRRASRSGTTRPGATTKIGGGMRLHHADLHRRRVRAQHAPARARRART